MRLSWLVAGLLAIPLVAAAEPAVLYVDEERTLLIGALGVSTSDVAGIDTTTASMFVPVDDCHRELRGSLSWEPREYKVEAGSRSASIATSVRVQLANDTGLVPGADWNFSGGSGSFVKRVSPATDHSLLVTLTVGADVSLHAKVFGWVVPTEQGCA